MRIALGQINTTVGDMAGNAAKIADFASQAAACGAQIAAFPELAICGYPPRDLIERPAFVASAEVELTKLAEKTAHLPITIVTGTVAAARADSGKQAVNAAAVLRGGKEIFRQTKMLLPTYDVFDEGRYFLPGKKQVPFEDVGITVCEDAWNDKHYWRHPLYQRDPVDELVADGAKLLISINASPYHMGKRAQRTQMFQALACRHAIPVLYVNQVGGNDQLVFDGSSFAMSAHGELIAQAASFQEDLVIVDTESPTVQYNRTFANESEAVYEALVLGTRDYLTKCGFKRVLIGLSGGIDSSLTAVVAVDAVGRENVTGIAMPGPFSSDHSVADARAMAERLGIRFEIIPITEGYGKMLDGLDPVFGPDNKRDVTEENIQARLRGLTLMALSNKWGALVLTTGNKSELAVGYCTLYGDMCGGLAVISDVPKTLVYELSRIGSQRHGGAIPESVFTKPPSAELRPDQKDSDSLPEYDVLDAILRLYVEEMQPPPRIAADLGLPLDLVRDIARKVDRNEYKRQQAAPGLKVTTKAFGIGRRFPIAQRFTE
ncbi:MAG: NAD+ synthase [Acidobacteria bacterium]|nr:NAD+ synthase [Acidobacteriota bacterium]